MSEDSRTAPPAWIRFARAEGHDAYWAHRASFFELLRAAPAAVLEVGCGEGRVTRDLRARGYGITGLDVAPTLVEAARNADSSVSGGGSRATAALPGVGVTAACACPVPRLACRESA